MMLSDAKDDDGFVVEAFLGTLKAGNVREDCIGNFVGASVAMAAQ